MQTSPRPEEIARYRRRWSPRWLKQSQSDGETLTLAATIYEQIVEHCQGSCSVAPPIGDAISQARIGLIS
jgi:hypothetical protein